MRSDPPVTDLVTRARDSDQPLDRVRDLASSHGWLATTTQRECGRILRAARKPQAPGYVLAAQNITDKQTGIAQHQLIIAERNAVVHKAFIRPSQTASGQPPCSPKTRPPCTQISASLNILVGSIGPNRLGCLDKLRRHPATAALINTEAHSTRSDINGPKPMVQ